MTEPAATNPLSLTVDAELDHALAAGWAAWHAAAIGKPHKAVVRWLVSRPHGGIEAEDAATLLEPLLASDVPPEDRALAAADLAELAADDPELASMLWESVLETGRDASDAELLFEGSSRLAEIEEEYGDPLTAAEYYIDFLNWRRTGDHASDPEAVLSAFDEITRLAEADDAPPAAARYSHDQAQFLRAVEAGLPSAEVGDWMPGAAQFTAWDSD